MKQTKERSVVNPAVDDAVTADDALRAGEESIAKYADGLESTDEALAAVAAADRRLQTSQHRTRKNATQPRTANTHTKQRARTGTQKTHAKNSTIRATAKKGDARRSR